ncbi:hypothetical protein J437_LFUL001887 [Ladona fulva]|uniref:Uncharacterized protein n=1 Tax=Ladona fulva TaxID=123851 RepID=A0A8K0JVN5_LADFU|nr:hypothetical protein J437_LFUL001887 [Ladona fulva]
MTYYTTALTWLRLIDVKCRQGRVTLTSAEKDLRKATMEDQFNVPQPIYTYLSQIGGVSDKGGKTTELDVPNLAVTRVQGYGGYHAATIDAQTHNQFEELPSMGIAGDVLMALRRMIVNWELAFRHPFSPTEE